MGGLPIPRHPRPLRLRHRTLSASRTWGSFLCGIRSGAIGRGATHVAYRPIEVTPSDVRFRRAKRTLSTVAHRDLDFMSTHLVLPDDDLGADIYPAIQIDHVIVDKTKAAG
jgi:hypothetical protein